MECYSYSRLGSYDDCPRKYSFCYVEKIPRGAGTIEAFMGSRVHEALERLYRDVRMGRTPSADELVTFYSQAWEEAFHEDVRVVRDTYDADDYRAVGERALRAFHARYAPFDAGVTVGLEQRIELDLDGTGAYNIVGYVDRLVKVADGVWEIHDYKTGQTLPTQAKVDEDTQLALYQLAVESMYPDVREVTLVWHYLAFDQEFRSVRTRAQLEALRAETIARIDALRAADTFPTKPSALCGWCEYRPTCPAFAHECAMTALSEDERLQDPAVVLVDRYVDVTERVAALKSEQEQLRAEIVARADAEGLDVLCGTAQQARVFRYTNVSLPAYDDPRRDEVERILRDDGLWDRFSQVATVKLSKAIESKGLPADTMDRLDAFLNISRGAKLYLRQRRM